MILSRIFFPQIHPDTHSKHTQTHIYTTTPTKIFSSQNKQLEVWVSKMALCDIVIQLKAAMFQHLLNEVECNIIHTYVPVLLPLDYCTFSIFFTLLL